MIPPAQLARDGTAHLGHARGNPAKTSSDSIGRSGDAESGHGIPVGSEDGRRQAFDPCDDFLVVNGVTALANGVELFSQMVPARQGARGEALEFQSFYDVIALLRRQVCQQRLSDSGAVDGLSGADLRAEDDTARLREAFDDQHLVTPQGSQEDGLLEFVVQGLQLGERDIAIVELLEAHHAELEQPDAEAVLLGFGILIHELPVHQRIQKTVDR